MEKLREMMRNRTFWLVVLIIVFVIIFIIYIRKRGKEKEQSEFAKQIKKEAVKDKITEKEQELNQYLRKLWAEYAFWMRQYTIAYFNGSADITDTTKRMLRTQDQIGRSLGMWYGEKEGAKLSEAMKFQLVSFGDMLNGMKDKDKNKSVIGEKKWHDNTEKLVDLLVELNPKWGRVELSQHFKRYNEMMTNMAINRLRKKHNDEINSFDKAYVHAMNDIADVLTKGIVRQHPDQFDKLPEPELASEHKEEKEA
jgi:hypothetical protein